MRPKSKTLTLLTPALNNVATDQTTAGAGNFTIDGSLASGGSVTLTTAHRLDIESTGNISGVTFTITGTDQNGDAVSEDIAGPNATTVTTTNYFLTITQIAVDGAVGTNTSVGTTDEAVINDYPLNHVQPEFNVAVAANISGTIDYTVQHTFDNVLDGDSPTWHNHASLVNQTADADGNYDFPVMATRIVLNSYSAGATCVFTIIQGK